MFSILEIVKETGAVYNGGNAFVSAVCTDTRKLIENSVFVALTGDSFDGHDYIKTALDSGASFAVAMKDGNYPEGKVLRVHNTRSALLEIAGLHRRKIPAKIVAVTGSTGKTTTKEMIACALSSVLNTLKTEKNLNNEIGLANTLLGLLESHEVAVLEAGVDGPGQMEPMAKAALPDIAVITNIGVTHIEAFGTRENIFSEKMKIASGNNETGTLVVCGDDDLLARVAIPGKNVIKYGIANHGADIRAENIREYSARTVFDLLYDGKSYGVKIPALGEHNVLNALAAFSVCAALRVPVGKAAAALENYVPSGMRQKIVKCGSFTVVEDCYNANPDSMRAALKTLGSMMCGGRRIAVLSDMLELGDIARDSHYKIGELAAKCGVDMLLCTGRLSEEYAAGARDAGLLDAHHYGTQEMLFNTIQKLAGPNDILWFKASRGMKLEAVMKKVYELNCLAQ